MHGTATQYPVLEYVRDGLNGHDLGVIGDFQYALTYHNLRPAEVYRRPAGMRGTYGGWRWECGAGFPVQYATILPETFGVLAERIQGAPR